MSSYGLIRTYVVGRSCTGDLGHSRDASCSELGHSAREIGLASCRAGGGRDVSRSDLYRGETDVNFRQSSNQDQTPGKNIPKHLKRIVRVEAHIHRLCDVLLETMV